jgi:AcrR family transcriptional regulator
VISAAGTPGTPSRADRTRRRILAIAARQFNAHGYDGTSLRTISKAASIKAGSLYYHFDSKDELLGEVIDAGVTVIHEAVVAAVEGLPPDAGVLQKLATAVHTHLAVLLEYSDFTSASIRIFGQVPEAVRRRNRLVRQHYGEYWSGLLRQAQRDGAMRRDVDLKLVRMLLLGMMNSTVEWYRPERGSGSRIADLVLQQFFAGVLTPAGRTRLAKAPRPKTAWPRRTAR